MPHSPGNYRTIYENVSGALTLLAGTGDTTLVTVRNASYTIFIQTIHVSVTTDDTATLSFEDSASTPVNIASTAASPGLGVALNVDFGDEGVPLTEGKNFELDVSAAGIAAKISWQGYSKLTAILDSSTGASNQ